MKCFTIFLAAVAMLAHTTWAQPGSFCAGDCDANGQVTVDEIITGVNVALGTTDIDACARFDTGGDRRVTVEEIVQAVAVALGGCQLDVTPTPTGPPPTATATVPAGASSIARRGAGTIEATTDLFLALPGLISVVLDQASRNAGGSAPQPRALLEVPFNCPAGGQGRLTCDQHIIVLPPSVSAPEYDLDLDQCQLNGVDDRLLKLNGRIELKGDEGDICAQTGDDFDLDIARFDLTATGSSVSTALSLSDLSGRLELGNSDAGCVARIILDLTGSAAITSQHGETSVATAGATFDDTHFEIAIDDASDHCEPLEYSVTVRDTATILSQGTSFTVDFDNYRLDAEVGADSTLVEISGGLSSACFGPQITFATPERLTIAERGDCPSSGAVNITYDGGAGAIRYTSEQLEIDRDGDGTFDEAFASCHDPALFVCPGGSSAQQASRAR